MNARELACIFLLAAPLTLALYGIWRMQPLVYLCFWVLELIIGVGPKSEKWPLQHIFRNSLLLGLMFSIPLIAVAR